MVLTGNIKRVCNRLQALAQIYGGKTSIKKSVYYKGVVTLKTK